MQFTKNYFLNFSKALQAIDLKNLDKAAKLIAETRKNKGRLFILGVGGSAGNSSHAVNDFRKLCNIEAYSPTDNVSEITARTNDEGFKTIFSEYLKVSNLNKKDTLLIFSVGGGNLKKNVSLNLIDAIKLAKKRKSKTICFVGKSDGYAFKNSNISILMSSPDKNFVTPVSEAMQAVLWHSLVSNPILQKQRTKW
ncbi:SIS domain-containing protein [Pelagibacterales bacterium SAG-MED03]|nr:SIS domain-containing protein [Pelagibacterales bacterium SAG-MED03]